ncbi:hypothetical protein QQM79_11670 [Marinobacteraceae bacterium S3BR75-40.1]
MSLRGVADRLLIILLALLLGACTSLYQAQKGNDPHGYSQKHLEGTLWQVTYQSYKDLTVQEVQQYALRRAAELSREAGYPAFRLKDVKVDGDITVEHRPAQVTTNASARGVPGAQDVAIPAYSREYRVKRVTLKIEMTEDTLEPSVIRVEDVI